MDQRNVGNDNRIVQADCLISVFAPPNEIARQDSKQHFARNPNTSDLRWQACEVYNLIVKQDSSHLSTLFFCRLQITVQRQESRSTRAICKLIVRDQPRLWPQNRAVRRFARGRGRPRTGGPRGPEVKAIACDDMPPHTCTTRRVIASHIMPRQATCHHTTRKHSHISWHDTPLHDTAQNDTALHT